MKTPINGKVEEVNGHSSLNGKTNGSSTLNGHESALVRYSDEDLKEFKILILKKLEEKREELRMLSVDIGNTTDDTSPRSMSQDDPKINVDKEEHAKFVRRLESLIQCLEYALIRIENKTYGIDQSTGKLIPKERLLLVLHATKSVETKLLQQKKLMCATMHTIH